MRLFILLFLLGGALFAVPFIPTPAWAVGALSYHDFSHNPSTKRLLSYLKAQESPLLISGLVAQIDLNDDGLNEFVLRQCPNENADLCTHIIWAEQAREYLELAQISALRIEVGAKKTSGVRSIISYPDRINDYNSIVYVWDAANSRYIKE